MRSLCRAHALVEDGAGKIGKAPESKGVEARLRKSCPTDNGKS